MTGSGKRVCISNLGITFLIMFFIALISVQTEASTSFIDDFSGGINTDHWTVTAGAYTIDDTQGDIRISKPAGGGAWAQVFFGHDLYGDFDVSVDYSDAVLAGCQNQIQLNLIFGGQYVADRRENWCASRYSVWLDPGGTVGETGTSDTSGTLRVTRVGSVVTFYANGSQIYQGTFNDSPVTDLWLSLQNNGTADAISVTFDNFSITADSIDGVCTPPPSGLVSWWKAEDNADDTIGTNDGALMNGATYAAGKVGQAFSFDGVDDYVQIGANPNLVMTNAMTVDAWIYPAGSGSPVHGGILVNKEGEYEVARYPDGTIRWAFANTVPGWVWIDTGYVVPQDEWTHIAVAYDAGVVRTYANGNLVHTYAGAGSIGDAQPSENDFRIGGRQLGEQYFNGLIDEVEVFNRALTAEEIAAIYNAGNAGKCILEYTLNINKTGTGSGTVTSDPEGIDCTGTTENIALNKTVTALTNTVTGSPGAVNDGDTGNVWYSYQSCPTSYNSFSIDLESSRTIKEIHFYPAQIYTYTIWSSDDGESWTERHAGSGDPFFTSDVTIAVDGAYSTRYIKYEGVNNGCGYAGMVEFEVYEAAGCSSTYNSSTDITLTATPDAGSYFAGWSGDEDCSDGEVTMDADKTCTAEFNIITEPLPDLTGSWEEQVAEKCKEKKEGLVCKIKGKLIITNIGEADAHNVHLRIYLSDDDSYDEGDILLEENNKGDVVVGKTYRKSLKLTLPVGMSLADGYIIAYIDADDTTEESDEENNFVVYGEEDR